MKRINLEDFETMIIADLDVEQLHRARYSGSVQNWKDRRTDLYRVVYRGGESPHEV